MKNLSKVLTMAIAILFMSFNSEAQTVKTTTQSFDKKLEKTLISINQQKDAKGLIANINTLKRLSKAYPNEWLADYYVAFFSTKASIFVKDEKRKELLLNDAKKTLDQLKEKDNAIESEVLTAEGFYYYSLIAQNPQKNGRLYYQNVIGSYQKAKAIDKSNPRPALMLLIFQKGMAKHTGGENPNYCDDLVKVEELFENFKPKGRNNPQWGKDMLKREQKSCK